MNHTPGPWFIFGNGHCVGGPHEQNGTAGIAMCGMQLREPEEIAANVALIAAAPALLAACKMVQDDPGLTASANDVIRSAIALAEKGECP